MNPHTRAGYLKALGIPLWVRPERLADYAGPEAEIAAGVAAEPVAVTAAPVAEPAPVPQPAPAPKAVPETAPAKTPAPPAAEPASRAPRAVRLGPGEGPALLLCAGPGEASGALANDVCRALGGQPAWAWPDSGEQGMPVAEAAEERMFTAIVIFGAGLARTLFGGKPPVSCGAARVVIAPSMAELKSGPDARRACWKALLESGVVRAP
ncbi:hypothetical protein F3N42_10490 [Marinihelvus fidelis]|uniref:Uncharacterized protein n=1 Tax=Marinihelvus fidelis TaxID=2613842 RepID=A0A5N0T739_9GAMM|nr:hypothetical protein [Marinihelvus fidelis]KAA9130793.1 hypothetical protein F3N42_10490 [Marinihelvus fidelis]